MKAKIRLFDNTRPPLPHQVHKVKVAYNTIEDIRNGTSFYEFAPNKNIDTIGVGHHLIFECELERRGELKTTTRRIMRMDGRKAFFR